MSRVQRVALVAGGGSIGEGIGNGRAAAILLARDGFSVAVGDRDEALARRTVATIEAEGGSAMAYGVDLTVEQECADAVRTVREWQGRVDVLVNNAGMHRRATVIEEDAQSWESLFRLNVTAAMMMSRNVVLAMLEQGDGGCIVNISSISALRPQGLTAYAASKGAIHSLTMAMAVDHGPDGIRVNCVAPGPVYTPHVAADGLMSEATRERRTSASLLGVEGTGWDVGHAVAFLASDKARYITGQILVVDGGTILSAKAR